MTIPDEAVQAVAEAVMITKEEARDVIEAALPFLQGVKVKNIETAPKNGEEFLARCGEEWPWFSCFWDGSAFVHYDATDGIVHYPATEWMPMPERILSAIEVAPSPRAQALEVTDDMLNAGQERLCQLSASTNFNDYEQAEIFKAMFEASGLSDLSFQPVANGWLPIDGKNRQKSDRILAVATGNIERISWNDPAAVVTVKAFDGPFVCHVHENGEGFTDEFGEVYRADGIVIDAEDLTAADNVLRLTHLRPLPASPGASE